MNHKLEVGERRSLASLYTLTTDCDMGKLGSVPNSFVSAGMFTVVASLVAVSFVSSEVRPIHYKRGNACTTDEPQTLVKKKSKVHCAVAGVDQFRYREFTFDEKTKYCGLYKHKPLLCTDCLR